MKTFYWILANTFIANTTNNFVWFAITFWAYLETQSVVTTSFLSGAYLVMAALSAIWFGSIVDRFKKKDALLYSSIATLALFISALIYYKMFPAEAFKSLTGVNIWFFILLTLSGVIAGGIKNIAIATLVTLLVPEDRRDKANGLVGTISGIAFAVTSIGSGLALAYTGMTGVLVIAIVLTVVVIAGLVPIQIKEEIERSSHHEAENHSNKKVDIRGTIKAINAVPGLFALIFFNAINNMLGGVFMSLMDAYGLTLVKVEVWGFLWGLLSLGFIFGGLIVARKGVGKRPLRSMLIANMIMWTSASLFTVNSWIGLLLIGTFIWICLIPFVEAAEQTVLQKVVPYERQGRVFGFAQSVEQSVSPLVAFLIGPIAQFIFIPFMTTGLGADLIGSWYGTGTGRGIALIFSVAGILGLLLTIAAINSNSYKMLTKSLK